jgi:hypothetical protein
MKDKKGFTYFAAPSYEEAFRYVKRNFGTAGGGILQEVKAGATYRFKK